MLGDFYKKLGKSRAYFLKQGVDRHRLVFATASPIHSDRFLVIFSLVLVTLALVLVVFRRWAIASHFRQNCNQPKIVN